MSEADVRGGLVGEEAAEEPLVVADVDLVEAFGGGNGGGGRRRRWR